MALRKIGFLKGSSKGLDQLVMSKDYPIFWNMQAFRDENLRVNTYSAELKKIKKSGSRPLLVIRRILV